MNVSGVSNKFLYDFVSLAGKTSERQAQEVAEAVSKNNSSTVVNISAEGQALSNQVPEGLLRAALPSWWSDYIPKVNMLSSPEYSKVGSMVWADNYRETYKNEMREFGKIFNEAFASARAEYGINTQDDMYEKVIKNSEFSETLRQAVDAKVMAAPNALELMKTLGLR
ncbi:MAG: hypothetical protein AAGC78_11455 [Cellvibrio sp.]|uniref:hypothetical protein n=1 Tax=Cellvibrio sp. TaxID=1965322 RepID=UPI0031B09DBE